MMYKLTGLVLLMCLVTGVSLGSTNGMKAMGLEPMHPDTSAPDAWGYTWVKNTDPGGPTFNWVDITTRGTLVTGLADDNSVGPFDMFFNFPYYWYTANRFKVGSNGYIQFDNSTTAFAPAFAQCPNISPPNDLMAICVGDLVFAGQAGAAGQCYYWTNGNDSLVVSFLNVTEWESTINSNTRHTFQVILNKADSSITFQYGLQQGRYNSTNNTRLCIGIENATGQIGLNYVYSTAPPHALLPDSGAAIKIKRTVNTGLQVTDAGIVGGLNVSNLAKMFIAGSADTVQCVVKNFGTAAVTNAPVRYAITKTGQPSAFDTVIVPSLAVGQQVTITFPRLFTPAVTGPYSALFNVTVPGDVGPGNNSKTAEITSSSFTVGQNTLLSYESGTISGNNSWIGGGGFGVAFDLPPSAYPVRIESVFVSVAAVTVQPMTVQILDGSSGSPGAILAERTNVTAVVGMNAIDFRSDSVRITGGRFFVGAIGQIAFNYEATLPISYRTWEYTGGWNPYRTGDQQDYIIRASVQPYTPPAPTVLLANPGPSNNGGAVNWAMFFDLIAGPSAVNITDMTTASTAAAAANYSVQIFTRSGTALGGPVSSGPGSSTAGWTSLGSVPVTQGSVANGVSELFAVPTIHVNAGDTVGVAVQFATVGPRYFGTGTPPLETYSDANLTLVTGDARSAPFTATGTWFSSRALVGEIHYTTSAVDVKETGQEIPAVFALLQNYPNPFNPTTTIQFGLPVAADVTLKIYNVLGQEIMTLFNGQRGAGTFQAVWNGQSSAGNQVASGIYFYSLVAKSVDGRSTFTNIKKMLFLK